MTLSERFAAAAEDLIGVPFRLHGRDPATGLDCIGLVAAALSACGRTAVAPQSYRLRMADSEHLLAFAGRNGFVPATGICRKGDVHLVRPGPAQSHLLIATGTTNFVHAHAGLGRVVRHCGDLAWPLAQRWRLTRSIED